jgi:hypothetical protein
LSVYFFTTIVKKIKLLNANSFFSFLIYTDCKIGLQLFASMPLRLSFEVVDFAGGADEDNMDSAHFTVTPGEILVCRLFYS